MYNTRAELTSDILYKRFRAKYTWQVLANDIGKNALFTAAVCLGQIRSDKPTAEKLKQILNLDDDALYWLTQQGEGHLTISDILKDPFLTSLYNIVNLYGPAIHAVACEKYGDINLECVKQISVANNFDIEYEETDLNALEPTANIFNCVFKCQKYRDIAQPPSEVYRTTAWGSKFQYGSYTTLLSGYIIGTEFRSFILDLTNPDITDEEIKQQLNKIIDRFNNISLDERNKILAKIKNHKSETIYDEYRSALTEKYQNEAFISAMSKFPELEPVDYLISDGVFITTNFQFNAHRGLYSNAFLIPQNSFAALVNAYIAGIRSVEFDVLDTMDDENVVVHDLVTNRLDGTYNAAPVYIEQSSFDDLTNIDIGILNPLSPTPEVVSSGLRGLMNTKLVLSRMHYIMPEVTAYIDARNYSSVSVVRMLQKNPDFINNFVVKIYPFTMPGGAYDFIKNYADRENLSWDMARDALTKNKVNVLLAMGSVPSQANESTILSGNVQGFEFNYMLEIREMLPFATGSTLGVDKMEGKDIFDQEQLAWIEARTWATVHWCFGFCSIANVMIYQQNLTPSLQRLSSNQSPENIEEYKSMPVGDRINAAIIDNFNTIFKLTCLRKLNLTYRSNINEEYTHLAVPLANIRFGFSDRYPDFSFGRRKPESDVIVPRSIKDYLYKMDGTVYEKNDYAAKKMRSTLAVKEKIDELSDFNLPPAYSTTDLPTDLRAMSMRLLGRYSLPEDLIYRASGIVKDSLTPIDIEGFVPPEWTQHLFGDARAINPESFDNDYRELQSLVQKLRKLNLAYASLNLAVIDGSGVIMDVYALSLINKTIPVMAVDIDPDVLKAARNIVNSEEAKCADDIQKKSSQFKSNYGVAFAKYIYFDDDPEFPMQPPM